ncbi:MAG: glutathione S-transferase family protein [Litorimonas sp.]
MRTLYHFPLHPPSRMARITLAEKKLKVRETAVNPWEPEPEFSALTAEGMPPVLVDLTQHGTLTISGVRAISEYANDGSNRNPLLSEDAFERAEARRLCAWFDERFTAEVDAYILAEKVERAVLSQTQYDVGPADPEVLREGRAYLANHLTYLTSLLEKRDWLAGRRYSLGDIAAAAHLSCLDFLGEVSWREYPILKDWYQKIKSRPAFRPILGDRQPGLRAPRHYTDLDF